MCWNGVSVFVSSMQLFLYQHFIFLTESHWKPEWNSIHDLVKWRRYLVATRHQPAVVERTQCHAMFQPQIRNSFASCFFLRHSDTSCFPNRVIEALNGSSIPIFYHLFWSAPPSGEVLAHFGVDCGCNRINKWAQLDMVVNWFVTVVFSDFLYVSFLRS